MMHYAYFVGDIEEFHFLHLNHFVLIEALMVCKFGGDDGEMFYFCWLWYNLSQGRDCYEHRELGEFDLPSIVF